LLADGHRKKRKARAPTVAMGKAKAGQ